MLTSLAKNVALVGLCAALVLPASPTYAVSADEPDVYEMATDAVIARPVGTAITILGAAAFVVTLPFSALGGNIKQSAQTLVVKPAKETFVRCLGCRSSGRYIDPNKVSE